MAGVRRWAKLCGILTVLALAALVAGVTVDGLSVRRELAAARQALQVAWSALARGDAEAASAALADAERRSLAAERTARGPWLRALGWLPVAGRSTDALLALARVGGRLAQAGRLLAATIEDLPGGLASLAPSGGRLRPQPFVVLGEAAAAAAARVAEARAILDAAPHGWLPSPLSEGLARAEAEGARLHEQLTDAGAILRDAPALLGADRPRRYFLGAQNPAELRGTGGVIGAFSILTIDRGRFSLAPFRPIQSLPAPEPSEVPAPLPGYRASYDAFRTDGRFWLAMNLSPDFPSVARVLLDAYRAIRGEQLDGVMLADPFALRALLRVSGPVYVPRLDRTVGPGTVVPFTTVEAYSLYRDQATRKRALGEVARAAFERFLTRETSSPDELRVLARAAAEGHLLLYTTDAGVQASLERLGAGGALRADGRDLLAVVENSAGGTKLGPFLDRQLQVEIELWPDGAARTTVGLRLTNRTPASGLPRYVVGPRPGFAAEGETVQLVSFYCAPGCRLESARRDGEPTGLWAGNELGLPFFRDYFGTPRGAASEVELRLHRPSAWSGGPTGGIYRLRLPNQVTLRPTRLEVLVRAPEGMRFTDAGPGVELDGNLARWSGVPGRVLDLELRFAPPLVERWWRALTS